MSELVGLRYRWPNESARPDSTLTLFGMARSDPNPINHNWLVVSCRVGTACLATDPDMAQLRDSRTVPTRLAHKHASPASPSSTHIGARQRRCISLTDPAGATTARRAWAVVACRTRAPTPLVVQCAPPQTRGAAACSAERGGDGERERGAYKTKTWRGGAWE